MFCVVKKMDKKNIVLIFFLNLQDNKDKINIKYLPLIF